MPNTRIQQILDLNPNLFNFHKSSVDQCFTGRLEATPRLSEVTSLTVDDRHAELLAIWQEIGEDTEKKLLELRSNISSALDRVYDKAMEESVRKRIALEISVAESEKRLKGTLGNKASQGMAPRDLPLQKRLTMNLNKLQNLDRKRVGRYGWVGGFLVISELRERVVSLREVLELPPCSSSADLDELLSSTMEALQKVAPGRLPSTLSFTATEGAEKPIFQRLQKFYKTLRAMEDTWAESFSLTFDTDATSEEAVESLESVDPSNSSLNSSSEKRKSSLRKSRNRQHRRKPSEDATNLEQLSQKIFQKLDDIRKRAKDVMEKTQENEHEDTDSSHSLGSCVSSRSVDSCADSAFDSGAKCDSPLTPTSVLPERAQHSLNPFSTPPLLWLPRNLVIRKSYPASFTSHHVRVDVQGNSSKFSAAPQTQDISKPDQFIKSESKINQKTKSSGDQNAMDTLSSKNNDQLSKQETSKIESSLSDPITEKCIVPEKLPLLSSSTGPLPPSTANESSDTTPNILSKKMTDTSPHLSSLHSPVLPSSPAPSGANETKPSDLVLSQNVLRETQSPTETPPLRIQASPSPSVENKDTAASPKSTEKVMTNIASPLLTESTNPNPQAATSPSLAAASPSSVTVTDKIPAPPAPSPPAATPSRGGVKLPPPPPPFGANRSLQRSNSKLKRSSQISNLYRGWKRKFEGSAQPGKLSPGRKRVGGGGGGGKGGMAQALEEITRKSSFFQKIAKDVECFATEIEEMKTQIESFETKNMDDLLKFYLDVESLLEKLTDESQVLARFEGFPTKKLEVIRSAATLYSKLRKMATELKTWKVEPPISNQLDAITKYFEKVKKEIENVERAKDKESKAFQSQKIYFDYEILVRIKEAMVDLSSNCISLALEESKTTKAATKERSNTTRVKNDRQLMKCFQNLWKTLQFCYRVYGFAGGIDDRAEELTYLLAKEMDTYPQHYWSS